MQLGLAQHPVVHRSAGHWQRPLAVAGGAAAAISTGWLCAARSPLIAAGAVLGAIFGLWALRRADVALAGTIAIIALLPFGIIPARLGVAPTLLDVATAVVFLIWLARTAVRREPVRLTAASALLLAYAATLAAAYILSGEALRPNETARTFVKVLAAHLLFIPVLNLAGRGRTPRRLALWLAALAALQAVIGIVLYALPRPVTLWLLVSLGPLGYPTDGSVLRYRPDTDVLRATGTSVDPNMLGALLMVAGAILVPQALARRAVLPRAVTLALLAPIGLCLLLTESRGSWIGLAAGLLFVAFKHRRLWPVFVAGAALTPLLAPAQRFLGHLVSGLRAQDRAAAMRLGEIENALRIIGHHPWFGAGWSPEGKSIELAHTFGVSNVLLTVAERSGLIAAGIYLATLAVLALVLWPAVRRAFDDADDDGILIGLAAALLATQVAGMFDHHFVRYPHLVSLLWLVAALAVAHAAPWAMGRTAGAR